MQKENNIKFHTILLMITGLIIIACGLYIYFVAHTIYPDSTSSRVQNLNWLLRNFGRLPTTIIFVLIGCIFLFKGIGKLCKKNQ